MIVHLTLALTLVASPAPSPLAASPSPSASPSASPSLPPSTSASPANEFRSVALAYADGRLIVAGGGVLRVAADCACVRDVAGRTVILTLGTGGSVVALRWARPADGGRPAKDIPVSDYVFAPKAVDDEQLVTVTIDVTVPAQTPPTDDVYLSSERSGWNPAEIRLNRVDALHFSAQLKLPAGARFAYRITRGTFSTGERDVAFQLPPAHQLTATPGAVSHITVENWADITN